MSSADSTPILGHKIKAENSITIEGIKTARLHGIVATQSILPGEPSLQSLFVALDQPDLTCENFSQPITLKQSFSTQYRTDEQGPFEFTQILSVRSVTRLPVKLERGANLEPLYGYRLDCGYPQVTIAPLACRRTKAYFGSPKEIIANALADSGLEEKQFDLQLTGKAFTDNPGWYMQNGENTETFVRTILAENGGIMFLNNENVLTLLDNPAALADKCEYKVSATLENVDPNLQVRNITPVRFYNFRASSSHVPVQSLSINSHPQTKTDLRIGEGKFDSDTALSSHQLYPVHSGLVGDALNPLARNLLEADTYANNLYTATTTIPFNIGDVVDVSADDLSDKPQSLKLMVVAIKGQHSFELPNQQTNTHSSWTGIERGFVYYELTMIAADKLPRMPIPAISHAEIPFTAIVTDKNGKTDTKVAAADNEIYVGLLHGHERDAKGFTAKDIIPVADHIEAMSMTSSVPAPGTKVRVYYSPTTKSFTIDGRLMTGKYPMSTTIKNDSNAKQASEAWLTMMPNEITITVGPNNKTTATYSAAGYSFSHDSTMKFLLDKSFGVENAAAFAVKQAKSCSFQASSFSAKSDTPAIINTIKA